ncbi:MAG: four helix bundle protein [bacterium]
MEIFNLTKQFPEEERYSITDQIRRSSRSICANIGEAWHKRAYKKAFISTLNTALSEAAETQVWLEISLRSQYLSQDQFENLFDSCEQIIAQLLKMRSQSEKWIRAND